MKKHIFNLGRRRLPGLLWLFFHGGLLAAFLLSLFLGPLPRFNTSLFDILPPSHGLKQAALADAVLADRTGRSVTLLAYSPDFAVAKEAAALLYAAYAPAPDSTAPGSAVPAPGPAAGFFDELSFYVDGTATEELTAFLRTNSLKLLDSDRVALLEEGGARLLAETLPRIAGGLQPEAQDEAAVSMATLLTKEMTRIDWNSPAQVVHDMVRGFDPVPGAFTCLPDGKLLKVWETRVTGIKTAKAPGTVAAVTKKEFTVACGDEELRILSVQPESKKRMPATVFLNGHGVKEGDVLGVLP